MARTPGYDKYGRRKGKWTPEEDQKLKDFVNKCGVTNWRLLPMLAGLSRCGKSCRLRWLNYLRPDVKRGNYSREEEEIITTMHQSLGNKWSAIAAHLPGRADNEVKNHWHTYLKKHLFPEQSSPSATLASHAATHSVTHSDHSPEKSFVEASSGEPEVHPDHAPSDTLNIASYAPLKSCTTYLPCSSSTSSPLSEPISISTVETGLIQTPISCNWEIGASSTEMLAVSPGRFWTEPFISETSVDTVIPGWDSGPYHFYGENFSFHLESPRFYDSIMMFKDH